jgi:hypothetical protein
MKTIYLIIPLCILSFSHLFGRIKNGYEPQIQNSKIALQKLRMLLYEKKHMSMAQRVRVKSEIENLTNYVCYYELTEALIHQLRIVSPDIFDEADNLEDKRGRPTDIYVKLIPKELARIRLEGASFFAQASVDEDANHSVYGDYSVAVDIWFSNNVLFLLSHELGHIKYIVPNLATYCKFYNKHYYKERVNLDRIGHLRFDPSGKSANTFERRFVEDLKAYSKNIGKRPEDFFSLMARIRKTMRNSESMQPAEAIVSSDTF